MDDDDYTPLCDAPPEFVRRYTLALAQDVWMGSMTIKGEAPKLSPEEAFSHAEAFVAEALRRGY